MEENDDHEDMCNKVNENCDPPESEQVDMCKVEKIELEGGIDKDLEDDQAEDC